MTALAIVLLAASAVLFIYAGLVSLLTSGRVALNGPSGHTPLYDQTCLENGIDPLEGTP